MWGDIILSIVSSVSEATCSYVLDKKYCNKFNNRLKTIITKTYDDFADSSLDCDDFYRLTQSDRFTELIRNLFFSVNDRKSTEEYIRNIEAYICKEYPHMQHTDVRSFLNKTLDLYEKELHKMIRDSPKLNVVFQLMTLSHREVIGKILESESNLLKYFDSITSKNFQIDNDDIKAYHDVCEKEYSSIRFTGISGAESKKGQSIYDFYVENVFSCFSRELENLYVDVADVLGSMRLKDFFKYSKKIVLVGGAGLGKSTTMNYLFCKYEELYQLNALKIKIDLKEYAKDIFEDKRDLLWCLTSEFCKKISRKKVDFIGAEKILSEYLDRGNCLIILDALDEIPTQSIRNKVRDEIARFCDIYFLNRFIITTREVGYLRNRFDETFLHIRINEFTDQQIKQYSKNWFKFNYIAKDFDDFWLHFYHEVERAHCQNLICNPIILILALVIFDVQKNLPNRRVEFYKKCIDTFLTVREDRKAAFILTEKGKNILGIDLVVPKIAFYMFDHIRDRTSYKFNYEELKNAILKAIEVDDPINWIEAVRLYAQYLVERTELIQEIDEDTLDFAHKTFYEYFLAVYFSKECENETLVDQLNMWIGDSNYDELARLIIEIVIQNDEPRQHKYLINYMLNSLQMHSLEHPKIQNQNIFDILADLYNHNMLQPKFHTKYYECILYYPEYIFGFYRRSKMHEYTHFSNHTPYDSQILADMFIKVVNKDGIAKVLHAIYFLNNDFKQCVLKSIKEDYLLHITKLFSACFEMVHNKNRFVKTIKYEQEINYFLSPEGIFYTLRYPEVYICVIDLILKIGCNEKLVELLDYKFQPNSDFHIFTNPEILINLFSISCDSSECFLITLILFIHCARKNTNRIFSYAFDRFVNPHIENVYKDAVCNAKFLWDTLNGSETFEQFQKILSENRLYNKMFSNLYEKLYQDYVIIEKQLNLDSV